VDWRLAIGTAVFLANLQPVAGPAIDLAMIRYGSSISETATA
jgi:hypothetical protein